MEESSKIGILVRNTGWVYVGKIGTQVFAIITAILVIRNLDVEVYGTYNFLLKILVLFNVFTVSPVASVFNRYIPELIRDKDNKKVIRLGLMGIILVLTGSALLMLLLLVFRVPFSEFFGIPEIDKYKEALFAYLSLTVLKQLILSVLTSSLLHKHSSKLVLASSLFRSLALIFFLSRLNVSILLVVEAGAAALYIFPGIIIIVKNLTRMGKEETRETDSTINRSRVLKFGLFSSLNELGAGIVGKSSDFYIVSAISSPYNLGLYSFSNKIFEMIFRILPFREFLSVIRPLFFQKFSKKHDNKEFILVFNFMIKMLFPVFLLPVLYFIVFGKSLILLVFDPKYMEAYVLTAVILMSNTYLAFFIPVPLVVQLKEKMHILLISKIVVIFSILGGIYAMKHYGLIQVAMVTLVGDFLKNLLVVLLIRKHVKLVYKFWEFRNYLFLLMFNVPFFFLQDLYNSISVLLIISIVYGAFSGLLLIKTIIILPGEQEILDKMVNTNKLTRKIGRLVNLIYRLPPGVSWKENIK